MLRCIQGNTLQSANCCGVRALHKLESAIHMNPSVSSLHSCLKKGKQLLARRVAAIRRLGREKQYSSMRFTPHVMRKSATLSFCSEDWGRNYVKLFVLYQNEIFIGSEHLPGTDDGPGCFIFSGSYLASTSAKAKPCPEGFQ